MRAQQPVVVEGGDGPGGVAGLRRGAHGQRRAEAVLAQRGLGVVGLDQLHLRRGTPERVEHAVRVTGAERLCQVLDVLGRPEVLGQREHRAGGVAGEAGHDVGEHRARADGGQLAGVAHQHQARARADRLEQPTHHRQVDHRALVDHDHVVAQPVAAVVAEAGAVVGPPPQEAVQRGGHRAADAGAVGGIEVVELGQDGLLQPGRGAAGRRRQRDREPLAAGGGLVGEQDQQPGDGGGLAGAGPPGEHGGGLARGPDDGVLLSRAQVPPAHPVQGGGERGLVDRRGRVAEPGPEVGADLALQRVVAVEVDQRRLVVQDAGGDQRGRVEGGAPGRGLGPGQPGRERRDGGEVEADRARAERADRERDGEQHAFVALAAEVTDPPGDVEVAGLEDAGEVELPHQALRAGRQPAVVRPGGLEDLGHRAATPSIVPSTVPSTTPSRRSERSSSRSTGGRQEKTPHGRPSTTGVAGPHRPRR